MKFFDLEMDVCLSGGGRGVYWDRIGSDGNCGIIHWVRPIGNDNCAQSGKFKLTNETCRNKMIEELQNV